VLRTITAPELLKIMKAIHAAHLQPHANAEALVNDLLEVRPQLAPSPSDLCPPARVFCCMLALTIGHLRQWRRSIGACSVDTVDRPCLEAPQYRPRQEGVEVLQEHL
jgi:hypothetical protein